MSASACIVCETPLPVALASTGADRYDCPRCGEFKASSLAQDQLKSLSPLERSRISRWLYFNQPATLTVSNLPMIAKVRPPSLIEKAERLLRIFAEATEVPGRSITLEQIRTRNRGQFVELQHTGITDGQELAYVIGKALVDPGYLVRLNNNVGPQGYVIEPKGWEWLDSRGKHHEPSDTAFVAMWFDKSVENFFAGGLATSIEEAGYRPRRIDSVEHNNRIDDEIMAWIRRSRFLVADFTGHRGGVYFEAGFALGLGIPVIWTCREDALEKTHFDTRQYNFITWKDDAIDVFRKRLTNRIEATIGRGSYVPEGRMMVAGGKPSEGAPTGTGPAQNPAPRRAA